MGSSIARETQKEGLNCADFNDDDGDDGLAATPRA